MSQLKSANNITWNDFKARLARAWWSKGDDGLKFVWEAARRYNRKKYSGLCDLRTMKLSSVTDEIVVLRSDGKSPNGDPSDVEYVRAMWEWSQASLPGVAIGQPGRESWTDDEVWVVVVGTPA